MAARSDAVIIGAGHNGLVCAFYLARAGLKVRMLERRAVVGGAAVTEEFHPGFRNSTASYTVSLLNPKVMADMRLAERGLTIVERPIANFLPQPHGGYLKVGGGLERTQAEFRKFSHRDADALPAYYAALERAADVLRALALKTPPNAGGGLRALITLAVQGRAVAGLPMETQRDLLDLFAKSARAFLDGWFESEAVKAAFGFDAVVGHYASPETLGSAYVLLHHVFGEVNGKKGAWGHAIGGMGAITQAMRQACEEVGATIDLEAPVAQVLTRGGAAVGVRLASGETIDAPTVVANVGPRVLYEQLVDPDDLAPEFRRRVTGFKVGSGTFRMNVALAELPDFTCLPGKSVAEHHQSGIIIAPTLDYMDHAFTDARAFGWSRAPIVEMLIPSTVDDSLVASGRSPRGEPVLPTVRSDVAGWAQLGRRTRGGGRPDHRHGRRLRSELQGIDPWSDDPLAARPGAYLRPGRRRHISRRHVAGPAVGRASDPGPWRLSRTAQGPLHVRGGNPSRRRGHRRARPQRRARDPRRPRPLRSAIS